MPSGVREILQSNRYGIIVRLGDWEQMGEQIYKMYSQCDFYNSYKNICQEHFQDFAPK